MGAGASSPPVTCLSCPRLLTYLLLAPRAAFRAKTLFTPYFRSFTNIDPTYRGKTFVANPRLFRSDLALYFPNLQGLTLADASAPQDTTPVLCGRVSVVTLYSSRWGEEQAQTWVDGQQNPRVEQALREAPEGVAQKVDINVEENPLKAGILKLFFFNLRRQRPVEEHGRYFVVRRGVSHSIRETIGLVNEKVCYVYLLDRNCKIRWAGSGDATPEEKESMAKGLRKLIYEAQSRNGAESAEQVLKEDLEGRAAAAAAATS
ncbi:ATP10 protein-domain-containing protein [Lineolata rhizophorae]|uniref:ATP10 protein-domain-containing protein n=1 Tax=Lineolata rhizophorae TaxID=578093 RepID=A0A6A6NYY5_9PEZI|nr:ATP10 protein-domain-containing protein [Lineolata rhizophorae]